MDELLTRYLHFVGIIMLASTLVVEHFLISREMTLAQFNTLAKVDRLYGISALVTLVAGLTLVFIVGKPQAFYLKNAVFHAKLTLFVVVGIISLVPTLFIAKHRRSTEPSVRVPKYIIMLIRIQLLALVLMPLLAVFMARGIGQF